jgi:hypothetical protein
MMMCLLLRIVQSVIETKHVDALVLVGDEDVAGRRSRKGPLVEKT